MVDKTAIRRQVQQAMETALTYAAVIAQDTINAYLSDLEQHIGKIPSNTSSDLGWEPLDNETEAGHRFWYKTGAVANSIVSKVTIEKDRIRVVAGLPRGAPGYQEALWNEFGWSPHNSSKVVRRALFVPLAEHHLLELNVKLKETFAKMKLNIKVKI
jgi:hypothetical protein